MHTTVYSNEELYSQDKFRSFDGTASEAAFLLGGIGTGNFSIGARGEFRDWEIFNSPGKGNRLPYAFFAIWGKSEGEEPFARVLQSKINPPFSNSHGIHFEEMGGIQRFKKSTMKGEYPLVRIALEDDALPVDVTLEAFTPLIPLNPDDSGIPCAVLKYTVKNKTRRNIDVSVLGSLSNASGFNGYNAYGKLKEELFQGNYNKYIDENDFKGLYMDSDLSKDHARYGNLSLATISRRVTVKPYWYNDEWTDGIQDMWDDFRDDGLLESDCKPFEGRLKVGSIGAVDSLEPFEEKEFVFILSWYFPNRVSGWPRKFEVDLSRRKITHNYYTSMFGNSWEVARYVVRNLDRLHNDTIAFHDALFKSSLPDYVIDAAASNIAVIRSTTCFWLVNGKFYSWEGCFDQAGCCEGNCTHVWNYAHTMAFLFPSLERDMRVTEFNIETEEDGKMNFRGNKSFGEAFAHFPHPAVDGQLGSIIKLYREWKLSGDTGFLLSVWDNAKKALDFTFSYWDKNEDFVIDGQQHNTYDIELYGPNSFANSIFYGALKAAVEMAEYVGDDESARRYAEAFKFGASRMDALLWNGEYYIQQLKDVNQYKYQYGMGCLSDQLLGQLNSHVAGIGYVLPKGHVEKAVESVFRYNFKTDFTEHISTQRTYVLNDEKGLLMCSWPKGGRPRLPFVYSDEVWTGVEYQVAAHLIYEGFVDEGLTIVKAVRDRHDGVKRNPWNEVECGHHYVRSMSSWALVIALSGFKYDLVEGVIEFNPVVSTDNFSCFFSCGKAWGVFIRSFDSSTDSYRCEVETLYGSLEGIRVKVYGEYI